jgi:hypothetical protein
LERFTDVIAHFPSPARPMSGIGHARGRLNDSPP